MSQTQDEFFQSMLAPRDAFGDEATDMMVQGDKTVGENTQGDKTKTLRYGVAALVGGAIGIAISHNYRLGPGGAELVPAVGAGIAIAMLNIRDRLVQTWDNFN